MRRFLLIIIWFISISIIAKIILPGQPLGYFWVVITMLSVFFAVQSEKKISIPEHSSYQLRSWISKYQDASYYQRQVLLTEIVNTALRNNHLKEAEQFLKYIVNSEPDNDVAKGMLLSIWSTAAGLSDN
ncbi:MAG: hypothetical protein ACOYVD_15255 [Bacillota bacterium]